MNEGVLTIILSGLLTPVALAADAPATTTLAIRGMTCGGCVAAVKLRLEKTEGVIACDVSLQRAEANVSYDPARTTPDKIAESVSETGFQASVKTAEAERRGEEVSGAVRKGERAGGECQRDCYQSGRPSAAPAQDSEVTGLASLAEDVARLASDFNGAKARTRFLAILSPTCSACVHGAEAIREAVLPARDTVEVFVVWAPMLEGDGPGPASASSAILRAPGVRQYWDPARRVGASFRKDVFPDALQRMKRSLPGDHFFGQYLVERDANQPEWDIYLFFGPGTEWTDRAPAPWRWVRQVARFGRGAGGELTSLLWINDYASAPVEGSLAEELRRLVPRPDGRLTAR